MLKKFLFFVTLMSGLYCCPAWAQDENSNIIVNECIVTEKPTGVMAIQPSYSDEDLWILAHVLAGECQDYPDIEQLYVGSVVLNRVAHHSYPDTIYEVVFQKGQYSCVRDGNYYREPTQRNWDNARWLLENGSILPEFVIYQSMGKQGRGTYIQTKYHYYCYN